MSAQVNTVFTGKDESLSRTLKNIEGSASRVDKVLGTLKGRIRTAFEFHVINRGIALFERGIHRVLSLVPDLVNRGEQWAATVDAIADATGLSAERASELAAVQQRVGGSTDSLARGFVALSRSVYTNRDAWKEMGVEIERNRDGSVDAYGTFQNLRRAISATGGSLLSTNAAQTALGKGGKEMLDLLQLTDEQYRMLARDARAAGQVMTGEALAAAEAWERAQQRFGSVLDGLGTKILGGLAPVLTRFVDGFSSWIQSNMDNLVRFVVGGANTILTVVGDLLGMDLGQWSFTEQVINAGNAATDADKGLRRWLRSLGEHPAKAAASSAATRDLADDVRNLERAQQALARLQRTGVGFTGDMSGYDRERALQARQMAIKEARERVDEMRKALADAARTAGAIGETAGSAYWKGFGKGAKGGGPKKGKGGGVADILGGMEQIITESTRLGLSISDAIKDAIFGEDTKKWVNAGIVVEQRSGGLLDGLKRVGDVFGTVGGHLGNLDRLLGGNGGLNGVIVALIAAIKLIPGWGVLGKVVPKAPGLLGTLAKSPFGPVGIAAALNAFLRQSGPKAPDEYGVLGGMGMTGYDAAMAIASPRVAAVREGIKRAVEAYLRTIFNGQPSQRRVPGEPANWEPLYGTPGSGSYPPGLGFNGAGLYGIQSLAAAMDRSQMGRALGASGDIPLALGNIATGISSLWTLIDERLPAGGTGTPPPNTGDSLAKRVDKLAARTTVVEAVNKAQSKRLDGLGGKVTAVATVNKVQALLITGLDKANDKQDTRIKAQGKLLDTHEARLDRLDGGGSGPRAQAARDSSIRKAGDNSERMVSILLKIEKNTRTGGGGGRTSSLRPAV